MKMFFELKIQPIVEKRVAEERALEQAELSSDTAAPDLNPAVEKTRRLRIQNAVLTECLTAETPEVLAIIEKTFKEEQDRYKAAEEEAAQMQKLEEDCDLRTEGRSPEELQKYVHLLFL
jgi:hypothetical protein